MNNILKVLESNLNFFLIEKSILYAKITVSQKIYIYILYCPFIFIITIMSQILINV